ncbi:interferon-induced helicase C domain-containing protein 1 [Nothobranchius furzeri]|uniref:RNA helicase n=1 Tax=Nothobranchius furzeri TaxID=105023 RepID=A0A1A8A7C1_NOTFU|nr:interferon-induced helicase C domain-containing protein 1 [Nothobranchius furzeri]KAF7215920.1 transcript variant X2 [Nothobranchius furzeri]
MEPDRGEEQLAENLRQRLRIMEPDKDEQQEELIKTFRHRLKEKISVGPVLNHLYFISHEDKERILQKLKTEGDASAANQLIDVVLKKPHPEGWFRAFVDALIHGDSKYAAMVLEGSPKPEEEEENDYCVALVRLLAPSLVQMKTADVCCECFSLGLLGQDDNDKVLAEIDTQGPGRGAGELLRRIVRRPPGWFSTFLQVLKKTEHYPLLRELTGDPHWCEQQGHSGAASGQEAVSCDNTVSMEISVTEEPDNDSTGLYASAEPSKSIDGLPPDLSYSEAAAEAPRSPEKTEIVLRDYQMEVARPALEGKNIIICLPTGSGKTRAAVYITKKHLDSRREAGSPGKVVVLVNKIPLVEQHYSTEFLPYLKQTYRVERVSGDSQLKISFAKTVQKNDIIICTAQILENYLERAENGEDEGVKMSDLTLIIIDECHHTQKGGVYNHIMMRYLMQKHKNLRLKKEQKKTVPLPQILGLTASPGVGGANTVAKAVEHIMRICANLDASEIMTRSQEEDRKQQRKTILTVENKAEDPFGDVIKTIMNAIHNEAKLSPICDLGSQNYEQWAVQKERQAAKEEDKTVRVCAEFLRRYNEGLILSNTIRMSDALSYLNKFHEEQIKKKTSVDGEQNIQITDTERFLFKLFKDKKEELETFSKNPKYENDSLSKLREQILREFSSRGQARGIIFTKTRHSAITLSQWIQENPKFADVEVKPSHVIGGGDQSDTKPMTAAEQKDVLKKFRAGEVNLLVATTVAEEGLDIPACNFVIRYGLSTNEIAMIQAKGRGRADDSSYTVVDVKNSGVAERECVNEYREEMMGKAINKIKGQSREAYQKQMMEFQLQAIMEERMRQVKRKQKAIKDEKPSHVKFSCRNCAKPVCSGEDIQIIENMHRVNVTTQFKELFIQRENATLQERLLDYETNAVIACKDCGQPWGSVMVYRGMDFPCLHVKNFVVNINGKKISNCTKWSDLPIRFTAFDYIEHASMMAQGSDEEMG